jgi:hypothetical protein
MKQGVPCRAVACCAVDVELIVPARYGQILPPSSPAISRALSMYTILLTGLHRPEARHAAFHRGVKLTGHQPLRHQRLTTAPSSNRMWSASRDQVEDLCAAAAISSGLYCRGR